MNLGKLDVIRFNNHSTALQAKLNQKVNKSTTVNGQPLSANVTVTTITGNAGTASALAANGSNCSSGQAALGVDASGNAEGCFPVQTPLIAGTDYLAPNGSAAALTGFPTLNQNTTGTSANVTGTIAVLNGGTGRATGTTAYSLVATGTTATGAQQTLANGATTQLLVGGGASALPVWTTASGSGAPVRATSPVLVTPVLGAATATSLASGTFATATGSTASTTGTPVTLFALPGNGLYLVYAYIAGANAATNFSAFAVVLVEGTTQRIAMQSDGAAMTISLSGANVQATQSSGISIAISHAYHRII